jgi:hypothetical protein
MDGPFDWFAFATGFCAALALVLLIRRRSAKRRDLDRPPPQPIAIPDDIKSTALKWRAEGRTIEAIKLVRERTGCDLRTAKIAVERLL